MKTICSRTYQATSAAFPRQSEPSGREASQPTLPKWTLVPVKSAAFWGSWQKLGAPPTSSRRVLGHAESEQCAENANPLFDLQEQRDQFALAMRVRLGKDEFH